MKNPFPKTNEDTVRAFIYPLQSKVPLQRPPNKKKSNFFDLALTRRSERSFGPLLLSQLDELLWYSAKAIRTYVQDNGYILSHRPSPSAGARHPIDIIVCKSLQSPVLNYYNPFDHSLNILDVKIDDAKQLMNHINENLPMQEGVFLWLLAHPPRTIAKYENAESLIWRDAGALMQQIQLTATALRITSCPIGTLAEPFAEKLFGHRGQIISVGGIIIGNS